MELLSLLGRRYDYQLFCCYCCLISIAVTVASSSVTFESVEDLTYTLTENERIKKLPQQLSKDHGAATTHLDAPYHANPKGWKIEDIPPCHFIREGISINVQDKSKNDPNFVLSVEDIKEWEKSNGNIIPEESVVLINFGWASRYDDKKLYFGSDNPSQFNFPRLGKEAAEFLITRRISAVGTDTASLDGSNGDTQHAVHKILAGANVYRLHNLALNNTKLPSKGFQLIAFPLKLDNAPGAPARVVALY